jgi:hypothetical protein
MGLVDSQTVLANNSWSAPGSWIDADVRSLCSLHANVFIREPAQELTFAARFRTDADGGVQRPRYSWHAL